MSPTTIRLSPEERAALDRATTAHLRSISAQLRIYIRAGLEREGFLHTRREG